MKATPLPTRRVGGGARLPALIAREVSITSDGRIEPFADDPAWLRLPLARRTEAMSRLDAVLELEALEGRGGPDFGAVSAIAKKHEISRNVLYKAQLAWCKRQSIWSLVPFADTVHVRMPRLDDDVRETLWRTIDGALLELPEASARQVVARVQDTWPGGRSAPSEPTIRAHVAARMEVGVGARPFALVVGSEPQEGVTASAQGDVTVIDHTTPDLFVEVATQPVRTTLTLAIDLHTTTVAGLRLNLAGPDPTTVLATVGDAIETTVKGRPLRGARPKLLLMTTSGRAWRELPGRLDEAGFEVRQTWSQNLRHGRATARLVGYGLGPVRLLARRTPEDAFDAKRHALLTPEQADAVLRDAAETHNRRRLEKLAMQG